MALDTRALRRVTSVEVLPNVLVHDFFYATADALAVVTTAGYFNNSRAALTVHSTIRAVVDYSGTANYVSLRVTAVPASGNVTVAIDTPAS